ncbi:MAG TPA: SDR family oxidoreductase [Solirubrobacteraceae bacterium]|nr:SDR family oxidoreductase [Solirubrobacteraceae bacterium]
MTCGPDRRPWHPHAVEKTVLLTGATGYVGGRLLKALEADDRHRVRCLTRRPEALAGRMAPDTEALAGDALDAASLARAMHGVDTAYYLIHSMDASGDFESLDRAAAKNFADAARNAGIRRIVYLGGLGGGSGLSSHLASRQEVGQILRLSGVPTIELRASIVIGSGSASYEIVRALVETLPVMITPRWVETAAQPIAIEDVIDYLLAAGEYQDSAIFEIGGEDRVSYGEIIREYAQQRGLRRRLIRLPLLTPRISRLCLALITPVYGRVAAAMVDSLRNETVVHTAAALEAFPVRPRGLKDSIARALVNEDRDFAQTRWSDALPRAQPLRWTGIAFGRRLVSSRVTRVDRPAAEAFAPIKRIGGRSGWYAGDWFWRARGLLDTLRGGVGLRRGRRDPIDLRVGDTVDFWRVEQLEPNRVLRLAAEMKIPGRLWLQFEVDPDGPGAAQIRQTTVFDPAGYVGLTYWYLFCPVHHFIFSAMLRAIGHAVTAGAPS